MAAGVGPMSARHSFGKRVRTRGGIHVATCRHCGTRRRLLTTTPAEGMRVEVFYALPGKTEWTNTSRRCADVREGRTNGK